MYDDTPAQVFDYHHSMLADELRTGRFVDAILGTVRAGDVVLDIGCGTGLLSLFACLAGARRVYAVEQGPVGHLAAPIAARNGYGDRIEVIPEWSTGAVLPERVDVIVSETIGNMAFDEGIVGWIADARHRLLRSGGRVVPAKLEMVTALVESWDDYADVDRWSRPLHGFDMSPLGELAANNPLGVSLAPGAIVSEPQLVASIDLAEAEGVDFDVRLRLVGRRPATVHGLGCWFTAELAPGVHVSNRPPNPAPSWDQMLLPLPSPLTLEAGGAVDVQIRCRANGGEWGWRAGSGPADLDEALWQSTSRGRLEPRRA